MGRRLSKQEREERNKFKLLIKKIRKSGTYVAWKNKILRRDIPSYPKIPKGIQVHHKTEISTLLREYEITSLDEAIKCKKLWERELGMCLKRGEHFIYTKLSRYKYLTKGFRELLETWINSCAEDNMDANKKRKKRS